MRIWSLHPSMLDRAALVSTWREGLLAQAVLRGMTKGYRNHPQLQRFRATADPPAVIASYLVGLADEAGRRQYSFDRARIASRADPSARLTVTQGQLEFEWRHLRAKVAMRAPSWIPNTESLLAHPLFDVVAGEIESWEKGASISPRSQDRWAPPKVGPTGPS